MGRKSSAKATHRPRPTPPPEQPRSKAPASLVAGADRRSRPRRRRRLTYLRSSSQPPSERASRPRRVRSRDRGDRLRRRILEAASRRQNLPPLQFPGYAPPRPPEVVTAAYQFAAEHPEILSYVPVLLRLRAQRPPRQRRLLRQGARRQRRRRSSGNEHGMECAVCIDVATQAAADVHVGRVGRATSARPIEQGDATASQNHAHTPTPDAARELIDTGIDG